MSEADERQPGEPGDVADEEFEAGDPADEQAPAWVRGAGVRWFGVAMFLVLGVVAVLVLAATLLAIYDRARDDTPPPAPLVATYAWDTARS